MILILLISLIIWLLYLHNFNQCMDVAHSTRVGWSSSVTHVTHDIHGYHADQMFRRTPKMCEG